MSKFYDLMLAVVRDVKKAVRTDAQTLTSEQKAQVRANIDALSSGDVNTVLQRAKESGLFDGKDGDPGEPGKDGRDGQDGEPGKDGAEGKNGADGITPHIGSNGHWYTGTTDTGVTATGPAGKDGKDGAPGKDGVDGQPGSPGKDGVNGKDGVDGYTPVAGKDYFTPTDKQEMINAVLEALPAAEEASF